MTVSNALAGVAVNDLGTAASWHERVFKRPADSRPMPEVAEWHFPRGGGLQVYRLPERAGTGSFTLATTGLDEQIAHLNKLKIDTSHRTSNEKVNTVMIADPDGNHIAFAEAFDMSLAR